MLRFHGDDLAKLKWDYFIFQTKVAVSLKSMSSGLISMDFSASIAQNPLQLCTHFMMNAPIFFFETPCVYPSRYTKWNMSADHTDRPTAGPQFHNTPWYLSIGIRLRN